MQIIEQLQAYIPALKRGWWIIALSMLFAVSLSLYSAYQATPIYQTSAKVIILPNPLVEREADMLKAQEVLQDQSLQTNHIEVLKSGTLREKAVAILPLTPEQLGILNRFVVNAVVLPQSSVIQLTVTGPDPTVAALLANALVEQGNIVFSQGQSSVYNIEFLDLATVPSTPISPTPARDAPIAAIIGIAIGLALVFIYDFLLRLWLHNRSVRESIQIAAAQVSETELSSNSQEHDPEIHPAEA